jgi:hypothetical protein
VQAAAVSAALEGFSAARSQPARLVGPDTCWVLVLYGRVFCAHHDRNVGLLRLYRLFRCVTGERVLCCWCRCWWTRIVVRQVVPDIHSLRRTCPRHSPGPPCPRDATSLAHQYEVYARQLELSVVDNVLLVRHAAAVEGLAGGCGGAKRRRGAGPGDMSWQAGTGVVVGEGCADVHEPHGPSIP